MANADWKQRKLWTDKFLIECGFIMDLHLKTPIGTTKVGSFIEDCKLMGDLINGQNMIGVRIRDYDKYYEKYGDEVTFRATQSTGAETEHSKIMSGHGNYFICGFSRPGDDWLSAFNLLDLDAYRKYVKENGTKNFSIQKNPDGCATFFGIKLKLIPGFVLRSVHVPMPF
jgi:hypothetical protein